MIISSFISPCYHLVRGNVSKLQDSLHPRPVQAPGLLKIHQHQVVLRASAYKAVFLLEQGLCKFARVLQNLLLVRFVLWGACLLECGSEGSDSVIVGTALQSWENCIGGGMERIRNELSLTKSVSFTFRKFYKS